MKNKHLLSKTSMGTSTFQPDLAHSTFTLGFLIMTVLSLMLAQPVFCSDSPYHKAMTENLLAMDQASSLVEKQTVANTFERIASAEKDKWLPYYYAGMVYALMSFETADAATKDTYAEKADELITKATELSPDESEICVIKALNYYAMIQADPMERGMEYMNKANDALSEAERLNADNPRIYYLRGQTLLNLPAEFGGGKDAALPVLEIAREKYQVFTPVDDIHPRWGKEDVKNLLTSIHED